MSKQRQRRRTRRQLQWLAASMMPLAVPAAALAQSAEATLPEVEVLGTAEQAWKQAPGVSVVTQDDLATQPTNDLSASSPASTSPATPPAASAATTARSICAAWAPRTR